MNNSYCVYKHTFPNGKVYIGITGNNVKTRWNNGKGYFSQPLMKEAIQEYGWDNIIHEILFDNISKEQAEQKEIELISKYNSSLFEYGYNLSIGGGKQSENSKQIIREKNKNKVKHLDSQKSDSYLLNIKIPSTLANLLKEKASKLNLGLSSLVRLTLTEFVKNNYQKEKQNV